MLGFPLIGVEMRPGSIMSESAMPNQMTYEWYSNRSVEPSVCWPGFCRFRQNYLGNNVNAHPSIIVHALFIWVPLKRLQRPRKVIKQGRCKLESFQKMDLPGSF